MRTGSSEFSINKERKKRDNYSTLTDLVGVDSAASESLAQVEVENERENSHDEEDKCKYEPTIEGRKEGILLDPDELRNQTLVSELDHNFMVIGVLNENEIGVVLYYVLVRDVQILLDLFVSDVIITERHRVI